jgi:hypothetical protein
MSAQRFTVASKTKRVEFEMDEVLQIEHFKSHVGKVFRFKGTPFAIPLARIVSDRRRLPKWAKRRPFLLLFRAPKQDVYMREGLYECEVEDGPTFTMYVSPIMTPEAQFQDYQAAFN